MIEFLSQLSPESLTAWGAGLAGLIGAVTVAVRKATPVWREIRSQLGVGGDELLTDMVRETRDMVRDHESRIVRLERPELHSVDRAAE